jgi:hypothetical protein
LTSNTARNASSVSASRSSCGTRNVVAALFTSTSTRSNRCRTRSAIARTASSSPTSARSATAAQPSAVSSSTTAAASSADRE